MVTGTFGGPRYLTIHGDRFFWWSSLSDLHVHLFPLHSRSKKFSEMRQNVVIELQAYKHNIFITSQVHGKDTDFKGESRVSGSTLSTLENWM